MNGQIINCSKFYKIPIIIIGLFIIYYYFFEIINNIYNKEKKNKEESLKKYNISKKKIIIMIILMLTVYGLCYFSFFPGLFNYDMLLQNCMAKGICNLSNHHPVLHTLIWKMCLFIETKLSIKNISIISYSILQMLIVIIIYIKFILWEIKNKWDLKYIYITYIFFLINPILHVFSFSPTKDVFFSCFLLLFLMCLFDSFHDKKNSFIKLIILSLFCSLFRNNFVYVLFVVAIILMFYKYKKQFVSIIITIVLYFFITNFLFAKLNIVKSNVAEKLSIPLVQISYSLNNTKVFNNNDKKILVRTAPNIYNYNPRLSDTIKTPFDENYYNQHKKQFWIVYLKGLKNNPKGYIVSALNLDIQYWYYDAELVDPYNKKEYIEDKLFDEEMHNRIPFVFKKIYNYYSKVDDTKVFYMNLPILNFFFTLSFNFYILIISLYLSINTKNNNNIIILMLLLLLLGTYLLGPIANFRYMYPFYFCLPFYLGLVFNKKSDIIK
ncbi:MAG: hypothetical protein J5970_03150 [Bacilli bacterium]|nr:hypothetical protein [Bacilli bacterium]